MEDQFLSNSNQSKFFESFERFSKDENGKRLSRLESLIIKYVLAPEDGFDIRRLLDLIGGWKKGWGVGYSECEVSLIVESDKKCEEGAGVDLGFGPF
jgi:hypothetical protein